MSLWRRRRAEAKAEPPARGPDELLCYFGHHKCATQWMRQIIADVCPAIGREQLIFNSPQDFDKDLAGAIPDPGRTFLCYMNADARFVRPIEHLRGVHLVRDPRDVVVSAYFSHLHSHPLFGTLGEHRERLQSLPEAEGIMLELEGRKFQFRAMLDWDYDDPRVLELRMEDVTNDAVTLIPRIFEFLGLGPEQGLGPQLLDRVVHSRDFAALAGRPPGEEDVTSHYRKGVAGDWVNHFQPEHVAYFKEHYNDLLIALGYETSADWG
jgi:hypothetical protein